jgi:hypothetical protein
MFITRLVPLAAAALVYGGTATAAVLCATRSGSVKLRAECRASETAIDPTALGLKGPKGDPGPAVLVKDANGALVGTGSAGFGDGAVPIVIRVNGAPIALSVLAQGFEEYLNLFYAAPGCTGPPLLLVEAGYLMPVGSAFQGKLYYATGPAGDHTIASSEFVARVCNGTTTARGTCCHNNSNPAVQEAATAATVDLASLGFVPPFHVEGP